ncbi:unnamed protein product [Sphagnum jensenii]|uniref:OB domain-containing protein n=1 Tax=Sphagnum jensenii TaxID=128206 RepID=A0ABP1B3G4_9BRYO
MHVGERESICGWVASQRSHGSVTFVNLRDHTGIVQVTTDPINFADTHKTAERLRIECVVAVEGTVHLHPKEVVNAWMATRLVEMFGGNDRYCHLDLQWPQMSTNLRLHHSMIRLIQRYLEDVLYFVQVCLSRPPILTRSTPEGAHDYLVPSRVQVLADTTNWHSILLLTSA